MLNPLFVALVAAFLVELIHILGALLTVSETCDAGHKIVIGKSGVIIVRN